MEKIGVFGGTFNPIHLEHVEMVKSAIKELNLTKMIVMPTFVSPHKQGVEVVDGKHRLKMLELAFDGVKEVEVSSYEIDKGGISFTYQTILYLKSVYEGAKLYYLMGSDMLENFPLWRNPEIIANNATLVLTTREGSGFIDSEIIKTVKDKFNAKVEKISYVGKNVSSTMVRVFNKLNLPISEFVGESVSDYIYKKNLYASDKYYNFVASKLTKKRLYHTAMVILTALKLCKAVGVSSDIAELSALLHDVAKYEKACDYPGFSIDGDVPSEVIHQFLGAYIVENVLGVKNIDIINAVKYHTTGRANMSSLEKLTFIADLIEPTRSFLGVENLQRAVFSDFESGFVLSVSELYKFLLKKQSPIYYLTGECYNYYVKGDLL